MPAPEREEAVPLRLAFDELYRDNLAAVHRFCVAHTGGVESGDEVTAEVFAAAFAAFDRVQPGADWVRPWLFRIAHNACVDHGRRLARQRRLTAILGGREGGGRDVEAQVATREELRRIVAAMQRLGRRDRVLVAARAAAGLPFDEVARITGMRENSARSATRRALDRLRRLLEEEKR